MFTAVPPLREHDRKSTAVTIDICLPAYSVPPTPTLSAFPSMPSNVDDDGESIIVYYDRRTSDGQSIVLCYGQNDIKSCAASISQ